MAATPYESQQWRTLRPRIYERDAGICQLCDQPVPRDSYDVDHIVPWDEGGAWYDPSNLRTSCQPCNRSRWQKRMKRLQRINRTQSTAPSRDW